jgi:hypothetical protein
MINLHFRRISSWTRQISVATAYMASASPLTSQEGRGRGRGEVIDLLVYYWYSDCYCAYNLKI